MTAHASTAPAGPLGALWRWFDRTILDLGRQMRLSYLPPLMVYVAAGIQGITAIVGTFFVKEYLGLSAAFLAALGFWATLPWTLKVPVGHLVDLMWKWKSLLVYLGASLIAVSLAIMIGLLGNPAAMRAIMPAEAWFVVSVLLAPVGYMLQDVVADAMTVEAVPRVEANGQSVSDEDRRVRQVTVQTLGRVAVIGGSVLVSAVNVAMFSGVAQMSSAEKAATYQHIYTLGLIIPVVSVFGVVLAGHLMRRQAKRLKARGFTPQEIDRALHGQHDKPEVNWWILGGGLAFVAFTLGMGLGQVPYDEEVVFGGSMAIIVFLIWKLTRELDPDARNTLLGTALLIFVFRAMPTPGAGSTWWMIDVLGFDQQFQSKLALITSTLTLLGLFLFRRFMAERSILYVIGFLTVAGTLLALPGLGMYYGLHHWTAAHTGGVVDARFIAVIDTALESPLGQVAMVPMLAWIANSAPDRLKATYFAVMASFTNLALAASNLGTKYLNHIFIVTREVKDAASGVVTIPADYSQLGHLFIAVILLGLCLPLAAIMLVKVTRFRSA
jgi:hypothetical protein